MNSDEIEAAAEKFGETLGRAFNSRGATWTIQVVARGLAFQTSWMRPAMGQALMRASFAKQDEIADHMKAIADGLELEADESRHKELLYRMARALWYASIPLHPKAQGDYFADGPVNPEDLRPRDLQHISHVRLLEAVRAAADANFSAIMAAIDDAGAKNADGEVVLRHGREAAPARTKQYICWYALTETIEHNMKLVP